MSLLAVVACGACVDRAAEHARPDVRVPVVEDIRLVSTLEAPYQVVLDDHVLRLGARRISLAALEAMMTARFPPPGEPLGGAGMPVAIDWVSRPTPAGGLPEAVDWTPDGPPSAPCAVPGPEPWGRLVGGVRGLQPAGRTARIAGEVGIFDHAAQPRVLVFADRTVSARALVDVVTATRGAIAVSARGLVGPLRVDFTDEAWIAIPPQTVELRLEADTNASARIAELPFERELCRVHVVLPVDILVGEGVTAQQLVDAMVMLQGVGVRMIGLGKS